MKHFKWVAGLASAALISSAVLAADPAAPAADAAATDTRVKVPAEFRSLNLTPEETTKILAIQEKLDAEINKLKKQAKIDQEAALTEAQRTALASDSAKAKLDAKAKAAEDKAAKLKAEADAAGATTQPAK